MTQRELLTLGASDESQVPNTVSFYTANQEMLRIAPDGFYVRGVKLDINEQEAQQVYTAFSQWLTWARLQQ